MSSVHEAGVPNASGPADVTSAIEVAGMTDVARPSEDLRARSGQVALELRGITKVFPGVRALSEVDFDVVYGRCVALIGENGAGKSTLMKVLSGVYIPDGGQMALDGKLYNPSGPRDAAANGVVLIHQELSLLPNLTLAENIFLGRAPRKLGMIDRRTMNREAAELLERVGLGHLAPDTLTANCSVAVQQLGEIAKALSQNPRVLVFDEPTASLGDDEVEILFRIVENLKSEGVAIVWITHRLAEIKDVGDQIVVLRDGRLVGRWDTADVPINDMVESMVGRNIENIYPTVDPYHEQVVLEVRNLTRTGEFEDISFELHAGEILGIAGLVGAGRTELVETIFGARRADSGEILLEGRKVNFGSPRDAVSEGIVLVPEDRKTQGLAQRLTIEDNVGLPKRAFTTGVMNNRALQNTVKEVISDVNLRGGLYQLASTLSGGNQQKGVIGKWLKMEPRVFIFDEPTRGIDVGARSAIYELIQQFARQGAAVIAVSSELPEVMGISNRILVLSSGHLAGTLERSDFTESSIMKLAVSQHAQDLEVTTQAS